MRQLVNKRQQYLKIRSRHPSHDVLRGKIEVTEPTVFRLGSPTVDGLHHCRNINTADACMNSANKRTMKEMFAQNNVTTALWCYPSNEDELRQWIADNGLENRRLIIKSLRGSRGRGLYLINDGGAVVDWFATRGYGGHIIEKYYDYNREYRLHVSRNGCFYTCRKMLRTDADQRWYRNDSNSVWIMEDNPQFAKPSNWNAIVEQCVNALNAVGLDIGACDVRVQSERPNRTPKFIICEINSAPSFGQVTAEKYINELKNLLT